MKTSQQTNMAFYQSLGKLFYAIAAADKHINKNEIDTLKTLVKKDWIQVDDYFDRFHSDTAYQIEIVFDWLVENPQSAKECFDSFVAFKAAHSSVFNKKVNTLIKKTAEAIAESFAETNKSEAKMLTQLTKVLNT